MKEPRWLTATIVQAIHVDQVREHGGRLGVRDRGLLESALGRPRNRFHHEPGSDLAALAASYGFGIARNHPFTDGDKRVAFQAMYVFLGLNGQQIDVPEAEVVAIMLAVASGDITEVELGRWVRSNALPRGNR